MAVARLLATFILMLYFKDIHGQLGLGNKPGLGLNNCPITSQQALQRKAGLISNPKNFNQISKTGNIGSNLIQQQNNKLHTQQTSNLQGINKQQTLNCQQQLNSQQQLNTQQQLNLQQQLNVQQPLNLNLQQSLPNQNVQSLNLKQPVNLQQQLFQQQNFPLSNLQTVPQQGCMQNDISLSSMPTNNGQFSGLPTQVSQGVLLSNLGLTSTLPNYLPNACGQTVGQISPSPFQNYALSQNNVVSNIPISIIDTSQAVNNMGPLSYVPVSFQSNPPDSMSFSLSNDCNGVNNPSKATMVPTSLQNTPTQSQQYVYLSQNSVAPLQNQPTQNELAQTVQSQSVNQGQSLPVAVSMKNQPSLPSFVFSPIPPFSPSVYPTSSVMPQFSNQATKSSGIKALLPLLLNLLKEKGPCCGCQSNNANCGCVNSNNPNFSNNIVQEPQVLTGYSNQVNYSPKKEELNHTASNTIDSEEINSSEVVKKRKKHRKYYKSKPESDEYEDDDEAEVYDNDD